jgi:hypothetical protein
MTSLCPHSREPAERMSNGTHLRLLWPQTTRQLWVEVRDADSDWAAAIPVQSEQAFDAFRHPYAYASLHGIPVAPESLSVSGGSSQAARIECREQ